MPEPKEPLGRILAAKSIEGKKAFKEQSAKITSSTEEWVKFWDKAETVAMVLSPESQKIIQEKVIKDLELIEKEYDVEFIIAGRDFPLHITIESAMPKDREKNPNRAMIERDAELKAKADAMTGNTYNFKYALTFNEGITLVADCVPPEVGALRDYLEKLYEKHGMRPAAPMNILHATLARFKRLPKGDGAEEKYGEVKKRLRDLRHSISLVNPLALRVDHFFVGANILGQDKL